MAQDQQLGSAFVLWLEVWGLRCPVAHSILSLFASPTDQMCSFISSFSFPFTRLLLYSVTFAYDMLTWVCLLMSVSDPHFDHCLIL